MVGCAAELQKVGFTNVEAIHQNTSKLFNNKHFSALLGSEKVFIKIYNSLKSYSAEIAAFEVLADSGTPVPTLVKQGVLDDSTWWSAFAFLDLDLPAKSEFDPITYAEVLAKIHNVSAQNASLRRSIITKAALESRISSSESMNPELFQTMKDLLDQIPDPLFQMSNLPVMNHGDFGARNLAYQSGGLILFDFEHAFLGDPLMDFGKIWDRELKANDDRKKFIEAYSERRIGGQFEFKKEMMQPVRLWVAAGIFPYAIQKDDADFFQHGLQLLKEIKKEWSF